MENLQTTRDVVTALGGNGAVAKLMGCQYNTASSWNVKGHFPPNTFALMQRELRHIGKAAPESLWKMTGAE